MEAGRARLRSSLIHVRVYSKSLSVYGRDTHSIYVVSFVLLCCPGHVVWSPCRARFCGASRQLLRGCVCRKVNAEIVSLLAKHTGNDEEKISKDINRPKYFSAYDAQDYGLIDRVLESEEKDVTEALQSISKGKYEWNLADKEPEEEKESET